MSEEKETESKEMRCSLDTLKHIVEVRNTLETVISELMTRAQEHDQTKLSEPELSYFANAVDLRQLTYGSPEYQKSKDDLQPALDHHYSMCRHHPEYHEKDEEWKPLLQDPSFYEVSSFGNLRQVGSKRLCSFNETPKGYLRVQLRNNKNFMVHRLVLSTFSGDRETPYQVNHINGDKRDNRLVNLEWATPSENQKHAYRQNLRDNQATTVVHCIELGISTIGFEKMCQELKNRGYPANPGAIWACVHSEKPKTYHRLHFTGSLISEIPARKGIDSMNLVDLVEMFCDWRASSKRQQGCSFINSLNVAGKRFALSYQLLSIFKNTADYLDQ